MRYNLLLLVPVLGIQLHAQTDSLVRSTDVRLEAFDEKVIEMVDTPEVFTIVEVMPEFPGGSEAMFKYLAHAVKYPDEAVKAGVQGTVYVQFVVDLNGTISEPRILRGIGHGCDEETLRVVNSMPNWTPGMQRGKPVRVRYNLPIRYTL